MPAVLCFGDSNTWGTPPSGTGRFGRGERWPGLVQEALGVATQVIEEGLPGRTSAYDDPIHPHMNGLAYLPVSLATHSPLELVVLALGTNDLFLPTRMSAEAAARGAAALVECVRSSGAGHDGRSPEVLVLVPAPFGPLGKWEPDSPHGFDESRRFSETFRIVAEREAFRLLDLSEVTAVSRLDGVHFDEDGHRAIAGAVLGALRDFGISSAT
jgi:lysophospholipase L1-like esterase